ATPKGAYPGHELGEIEWLRQVVVGTKSKATDPVLDGARGSQHQHSAIRAPSHDLPAHLVAGHAGQVSVQDHHVVAGDRQMTQRVVTVEDNIDRHTFAAKPGPDRAGQYLEILDDQHSHDGSSFRFLWGATSSSVMGRHDIGPTMTLPRCKPGVSR